MVPQANNRSARGNYWTEASAVQRYRDARPYFHTEVMALIRERLGLAEGGRLDQGVDIGCGTGQSTVALLELAQRAVGVDSSEQMLKHAERRDRIEYRTGSAEQIPVEDDSADILTASLAVHWFDLPAFLSEAARVLRPGGWLVAYGNGFSGQMLGNPEFLEWIRGVYNVKYPTPPRPHYDPSVDAFEASEFELLWPDEGGGSSTGSGRQASSDSGQTGAERKHPAQPYENEVTFSSEQLVAYLMTQSNVIAKVEQGTEGIEDVRSWLDQQVKPFFSRPEEIFLLRGTITYARLRSAD